MLGVPVAAVVVLCYRGCNSAFCFTAAVLSACLTRCAIARPLYYRTAACALVRTLSSSPCYRRVSGVSFVPLPALLSPRIV